MDQQKTSKLNLLEKSLPQGLVVDAAWLEERGFKPPLRSRYVKSGWLEQPARGLYRRPRGQMTDAPLGWQQVVISLQTLLGRPLIVGGATALDLHGLSHYLMPRLKAVHLYGPVPAPGWLGKLDLPQRFVTHNSARLFRRDPGLRRLATDARIGADRNLSTPQGGGVETRSWGQWDWPLTVSSAERAYLELLDGVPGQVPFHDADMIMQGAVNFRPRHLASLLHDCRSVKVKRLFLFFSDRHGHAWRRHLASDDFDLGKGKRQLVRGGRLDPVYLITVPRNLDGDH